MNMASASSADTPVVLRVCTRRSEFSSPRTTPDVRITGKKKMLLAMALPWKFWLIRVAAKKLKMMTRGTCTTIWPMPFNRFRLKSGSMVRALR